MCIGGYYTPNIEKARIQNLILGRYLLISPAAKGVWYDKLEGNFLPIWMSTVMCKIFNKNLVPRKILLLNMNFTDQNIDEPDFSVSC